jgi:hypothetical protein
MVTGTNYDNNVKSAQKALDEALAAKAQAEAAGEPFDQSVVETKALHNAFRAWHGTLRGRFVEEAVGVTNFKLGGFGFKPAGRKSIRKGGKVKHGPSMVAMPTIEELAKALNIDLDADE